MSQAQADAWVKVVERILEKDKMVLTPNLSGLECVLKWIDEHAGTVDASGLQEVVNRTLRERDDLKQKLTEAENAVRQVRMDRENYRVALVAIKIVVDRCKVGE